LRSTSEAFITATTAPDQDPATWSGKNSETWTDYVTKLYGWISRPSELSFTDPKIIQPKAQLESINMMTDVTKAGKTEGVC
jgi:hypothetical protein